MVAAEPRAEGEAPCITENWRGGRRTLRGLGREFCCEGVRLRALGCSSPERAGGV